MKHSSGSGLWVVMGVAGAGKTTAGHALAAHLDKFFLGAESGVMQGRTHDPNSSDEIRVRGTSAVLQGGATVDASGAVAVRVLAGLGALLGARLEDQDGFRVDDTAFLGYAGLEVEFRVTENIGLTGQGLARTCRLTQPDSAPYDVDFSGGSLRAGLCATFGGAP